MNCRMKTSEDMAAPVDTPSDNQDEERIEAPDIGRLDIKELPENEFELNEETYWDTSSQFGEGNNLNFEETAEAVTNHEAESEKKGYLDSLSQFGEGNDLNFEGEIY